MNHLEDSVMQTCWKEVYMPISGAIRWPRFKALLPITAGIIAAGIFILVLGQSPAQAAMDFGKEKFKVGDKATDFTCVDLDGGQVTLSSFQGKKVVLLNFWGVRCSACIEEMPHLNKLQDKYGGKDLVVLGVNTDGVDSTVIREAMKDGTIDPNYTFLLDQEFAVTDTYTNFLVPLTLVIDKKGIVQYIHTGYERGDEKHYEEAVRKALGL
jgi:peroxiredoxin